MNDFATLFTNQDSFSRDLLTFCADMGLLEATPSAGLFDVADLGLEGALISTREESTTTEPGRGIQRGSRNVRETVHLGPSEAGPCMHLNHAQPCNTCVEAPSAEEQDACELCGDKGKKNGGKLLRSLLKKTEQWRSVKLREQAARAAGRAGLGRLVDALVDGQVARLRKDEILFIARHWSLRSFIWRKRSSCSIKITAPDILQRVRTASERPRNRCVSPSSSDEEIDEAHARRQQSGDDSSDHTDVLEHADDAVPAPRKRARRIVPPRRYGDDADADTPHPAATTATEKYAFDSFSRPVTASSSDCSDSAAARTAAKPVSADVLARLSKLTVEANDIAMGRAAKDLCASIKGDGLTAARVSATHLAARALSELSRHADKVQTSANVSVFMREAMQTRRAAGASASSSAACCDNHHGADSALTEEDFQFETLVHDLCRQMERDCDHLQASLRERSGLSSLDFLDHVALRSWRKCHEILALLASELLAVRVGGSPVSYLRASVQLQEEFKRFRVSHEAALLYQATWAEELHELARANGPAEDGAEAAKKPAAAVAATSCAVEAGARQEATGFTVAQILAMGAAFNDSSAAPSA